MSALRCFTIDFLKPSPLASTRLFLENAPLRYHLNIRTTTLRPLKKGMADSRKSRVAINTRSSRRTTASRCPHNRERNWAKKNKSCLVRHMFVVISGRRERKFPHTRSLLAHFFQITSDRRWLTANSLLFPVNPQFTHHSSTSTATIYLLLERPACLACVTRKSAVSPFELVTPTSLKLL